MPDHGTRSAKRVLESCCLAWRMYHRVCEPGTSGVTIAGVRQSCSSGGRPIPSVALAQQMPAELGHRKR